MPGLSVLQACWHTQCIKPGARLADHISSAAALHATGRALSTCGLDPASAFLIRPPPSHSPPLPQAAYDAMAAAQITAAAAAARAAATVLVQQQQQQPQSAVVPDDPGLNPAAPAELLPLELPEGALAMERWGVRLPSGAGCVRLAPEYGREVFEQRFGELSFKTLLTQPEVISALVKIRLECAKVGVGDAGGCNPLPNWHGVGAHGLGDVVRHA